MVRIIFKSGLAIACLLAVAVFIPQANAGTIDFTCGGTACAGTVTAGGSLAFSTGTAIALTSDFDGADVFNATFSTNAAGTGTISISDGDGDSLSGNIVATSTGNGPFAGEEALTFNVNWTTTSSNVTTALGASSGAGISTVTFMVSGGQVVSADLSVSSGGTGPHSPTPEPSTLLLLGTGLLGVGFAFRRYSLA
jgi:PEP-CTERM motif-containing protein